MTGSVDLLIPSLFVMGFGIGGDFALDSDYVDEVMPKRWQETMVGITKSFSALGNLSAGGGFLVLCSIEWTAEISALVPHFTLRNSFPIIKMRQFLKGYPLSKLPHIIVLQTTLLSGFPVPALPFRWNLNECIYHTWNFYGC